MDSHFYNKSGHEYNYNKNLLPEYINMLTITFAHLLALNMKSELYILPH